MALSALSRIIVSVGAILTVPLMASRPAAAQAEPYIGQLMVTAASFCPRGWARADGQLLAISQFSAVFSLLGTNFGGDGRTTFALPDMRGRAAIHTGQGVGLSNYTLGERAGSETFNIGIANLPPHNHQVQATIEPSIEGGPRDKYLGSALGSGENKYSAGPPNRTMAADMITNTGEGLPVGHRDPYLALTWCIALEGIFPPRD